MRGGEVEGRRECRNREAGRLDNARGGWLAYPRASPGPESVTAGCGRIKTKDTQKVHQNCC